MRKRYTLTMLLACLCLVFLTPLPALCADGAEMAETVPGADIVAVILTYLPASWGGWVTLVISVCAAVAAFWPRPGDDAHPLVRLLYAIVNAIGFNNKKATNADDAGKKPLKSGGSGV